jgi:hypothetical protein
MIVKSVSFDDIHLQAYWQPLYVVKDAVPLGFCTQPPALADTSLLVPGSVGSAAGVTGLGVLPGRGVFVGTGRVVLPGRVPFPQP